MVPLQRNCSGVLGDDVPGWEVRRRPRGAGSIPSSESFPVNALGRCWLNGEFSWQLHTSHRVFMGLGVSPDPALWACGGVEFHPGSQCPEFGWPCYLPRALQFSG